MKKLKVLLLVLLIFPLCFIFSGCGTKTSSYEDNSRRRFVLVEKIQDNFETESGYIVHIYIAVDKETKIMYIVVDGYCRFSITPLLDENGKPMKYEGEL